MIGTLTGQPATQLGFLHCEAARGLELRHLLGVAGGHLLEVLRALLRVLLGHRLPRHLGLRGWGLGWSFFSSVIVSSSSSL